jgi:hypothetical protein
MKKSADLPVFYQLTTSMNAQPASLSRPRISLVKREEYPEPRKPTIPVLVDSMCTASNIFGGSDEQNSSFFNLLVESDYLVQEVATTAGDKVAERALCPQTSSRPQFSFSSLADQMVAPQAQGPGMSLVGMAHHQHRLRHHHHQHHQVSPLRRRLRLSSSSLRVASIFSTPSIFYQDKQSLTLDANLNKRLRSESEQPYYNNNSSATENKASSVYLHRACCLPEITTEQIKQLLLADPLAASRPATIVIHGSSPLYSYPLNLAIHHNARPEVLALLIQVAPQVLALPDGPTNTRQTYSLHLLLEHRPDDIKTVLEMIFANPKVTAMRDDELNYPLHIACLRNSPTETIHHLCTLYPEAKVGKNAQGKTPADLVEVRLASNRGVVENAVA